MTPLAIVISAGLAFSVSIAIAGIGLARVGAATASARFGSTR